MSLLSKILAFLNILGAVGLVFLATQTLARREVWQYANFLHDLKITGLPITEEDRDKQDYPIVERLEAGSHTLRELFPQSPVSTQVQEVKRLHAIIQGKIDEAPDTPEKLIRLAQVLLPLAETSDARFRLIALRVHLKDKNSNEQLKKQFAEAVRPALELMRNDREAGRPDARQRNFPEAYPEAMTLLRTEPKLPFMEAMLAELTTENAGYAKAFDAALKAEQADPAKKLEEVFVQTARGEAGKPFAKLMDEAYDRALGKLLADYQEKLDRFFQEAETGKRAGKVGTQELTQDQRRQAIANLLFNLVEVLTPPAADPAARPAVHEDAPYKRFITLVGLPEASRTLETQAGRLNRIAQEELIQIGRECTDFAILQASVATHVRERSIHVELQEETLKRIKAQADERGKLVDRRKEDVRIYQEQMDAARQETGERLKELKAMTRELFDIRLQVRDATLQNQQYEQDIRKMERRVRNEER